jgi:hypothetical protein
LFTIAHLYDRLITSITSHTKKWDTAKHVMQTVSEQGKHQIQDNVIKYVCFTRKSILNSLSSFSILQSMAISLKLGDWMRNFKLWLVTFDVVLSWYQPLALKVWPLNHVPNSSICNTNKCNVMRVWTLVNRTRGLADKVSMNYMETQKYKVLQLQCCLA